jgi:hypothetical protein
LNSPFAHRRQFVIGPRPLAPRPDWVSHEIANGVFLSHCPLLAVAVGQNAALLGIAVQTTDGRSAPEDLVLAGAPLGDTREWAGRWALVLDGVLELDAAGTLGCFHRRIGVEVWLSSSASLLAGLEPSLPVAPVAVEHARGMDWVPPPASGVPGLGRLLPTQVIAFDGRIDARVRPRPRQAAYPELLDELESRLVTARHRLAGAGGALRLPLSGGRDSRLLLAAATRAGVTVDAYTFEYDSMSRADRTLPARLAHAVGVEHRMISPGAVDTELLQIFDAHTAGLVVDIDRTFFARGQWSEVDGGAVDLGGGVFELARCYYHMKLPPLEELSAGTVAAAIGEHLATSHPEGVEQWAEWLVETPDTDLDWRDRFYLEQRSGGWLSSIGQALDLVGPARVHVASCGALIEAALGIPEVVRRTGAHHEHLIRRLAPELARFPINPPASAGERIRGRARREWQLFRREERVATYVTTRARQLAERRSVRRLA